MALRQTQLSSDFDALLEYGKKDLSFQGRHRILASKKAAESLISRGNIDQGYYALGLVNGYLNNNHEAAECFRKVYMLDANENNCFNYMNSLIDKGDIQSAFDLSKSFLRTNPNNLKIFMHALSSCVFHLLPEEFEEIERLFKGEKNQKLLEEIEDCRESLKIKEELLKKHEVDKKFYQLVSIISNQVIKEFVISPTCSRIFETPDKQSIILDYFVDYLNEDECYEMSEIFDTKLKQYLMDNYSDDFDFMSNIFNLCVVFTSDIDNKKFYQANKY